MSNAIFLSIDSAALDTVTGGIDRDTYTSVGRNAGELGGTVGGAVAGAATVPGTGPGAVAAAAGGGWAGGKVGAWAGEKIGGALWDAGTAIGDRVGRWMYGN